MSVCNWIQQTVRLNSANWHSPEDNTLSDTFILCFIDPKQKSKQFKPYRHYPIQHMMKAFRKNKLDRLTLREDEKYTTENKMLGPVWCSSSDKIHLPEVCDICRHLKHTHIHTHVHVDRDARAWEWRSIRRWISEIDRYVTNRLNKVRNKDEHSRPITDSGCC